MVRRSGSSLRLRQRLRLRVVPEHLHHALEREPLGDVQPGAQHLPELGPAQLLHVQPVLLGLAMGGDAAGRGRVGVRAIFI